MKKYITAYAGRPRRNFDSVCGELIVYYCCCCCLLPFVSNPSIMMMTERMVVSEKE